MERINAGIRNNVLSRQLVIHPASVKGDDSIYYRQVAQKRQQEQLLQRKRQQEKENE